MNSGNKDYIYLQPICLILYIKNRAVKIWFLFFRLSLCRHLITFGVDFFGPTVTATATATIASAAAAAAAATTATALA